MFTTVVISSLCALVVTMINAGIFARIARIEERLSAMAVDHEKRIVTIEVAKAEYEERRQSYARSH